jgi:hypothetical protein
MILCGVFGLGIFVVCYTACIMTNMFSLSLTLYQILSACLNKYYSFTQPFSPIWTFWYVRESSTAVLVSNLPYTWTLLRRIFGLSSFSGSTKSGTGNPSRSRRTRQDNTELTSQTHIKNRMFWDSKNSRSESQQDIAKPDNGSLKIWQATEFTVEHTYAAEIEDPSDCKKTYIPTSIGGTDYTTKTNVTTRDSSDQSLRRLSV